MIIRVEDYIQNILNKVDLYSVQESGVNFNVEYEIDGNTIVIEGRVCMNWTLGEYMLSINNEQAYNASGEKIEIHIPGFNDESDLQDIFNQMAA